MATTILNQLRASGGTDAIINTIELKSSGWLTPLFLCDGFVDTPLRDETGITRLAVATGMDVSLPTKDKTGSQRLRFAISNVRGEAVRLVREAIDNQQEIQLIYRSYVSSRTDEPADNPLHMIARQVSIKGDTVEVVAGFGDLIDTQYPRDVYTSEFAPGLKYLE